MLGAVAKFSMTSHARNFILVPSVGGVHGYASQVGCGES